MNAALRSGAESAAPRSLYTRLVAGVMFPLHERLKGHDSVRLRRQLEQSQWWPAARIEQDRLDRLRGFLAEVGRHVPYYRRLFAERDFEPEALRSVADLAALPCLTKPLIRDNVLALTSERARKLIRYNTGGSSGEPLVFFMGPDRVTHDVAAKWRATRWWNVDIGDPEVVIWGSPIELGAQDRVRALRDRLMRTRLLPAFEMSDAKVDAFIAEIRALRPPMLFGYPSSLALIAARAGERGVQLDDLGVRVAFVTSEKLYPHQRQAIETAFGCKVADGYGGRDAGFIAHQCPAGGMHISAEHIIVETLRPDGTQAAPGEPGEIVTTHLATADFPFIRYRTGDIGVLDDRPCACGRGLPLLREIEGRATDFVVAADGTVMHGLALIYVLRDLPGIAAFKIVQESIERTRVLVEPAAGFGADGEQRIRSGLAARLGQGVTIDIERVARIEPERSGKFRYVVSKVPVRQVQHHA